MFSHNKYINFVVNLRNLVIVSQVTYENTLIDKKRST